MSVYSYYTENTANGENSGASQPVNLLLTGMSEEVKFDNNIGGATVLNTDGNRGSSARNDAQIFADLESCGPA